MRQAEHGQTTAGKAVVDLNADMGESFGAWTMGNDAALMPLISSANIVWGFHSGDLSTVRATVNRAAARGGPLSPPDRADEYTRCSLLWCYHHTTHVWISRRKMVGNVESV